MHWWIILQVGEWLTGSRSPVALYLCSDEAFFAQPIAQQRIVLSHPDTLLLDAALFQATNEARRKASLPVFQYDQALYQAAQNHAESMIRYNYTSHDDLYQLDELTLLKRVRKQTNRFYQFSENIGQYQTIDTAEWYSVRFNAHRQQYEYVDTETKQLYEPFTYAAYARYAVSQWLASPHHRANLLNPAFTHVGCAGRLSAAPFTQKRAPFGRLVQDFGTLRGSGKTSQ